MFVLHLAFPCFSFVFSVSQQGLITTDKIYVIKRESFKKAKVNALWLLQPIQKLLCSRLLLSGGSEDYLGQHSLHLNSLEYLFYEIYILPDHITFFNEVIDFHTADILAPTL